MAVCDPQPGMSASGRALSSTSPTSTGFVLSLMSKMCRPSQPSGTGSPSHESWDDPVPVAGEFHERTRMSPQTTTSPWLPKHSVNEICFGLAGAAMLTIRKPV